MKDATPTAACTVADAKSPSLAAEPEPRLRRAETEADHGTHSAGTPAQRLDRRSLLIGAGAVAAGAAALAAIDALRPKAPVFLARHQRYDGPLARTIRDGLRAIGFDPLAVRGRHVLIKPNLVEPDRAFPHRTTHPAVVAAAIEVFRGFGAEVVVGEGAAHLRDTELIVGESGVGNVLADERLRMIDLNYSEIRTRANAGRASRLDRLHFPREAVEADLIVSLPKLKTHHWMGFTASMKNLYGVMPGAVYGWPKNVLHYAGIAETVVDINASLPPVLGIVDAIVCMEGDGPILGSPRTLGILAVGAVPSALDATLGRIAGFEPRRVPYLALAAEKLGPIDDRRIVQRGESWRELVDPLRSLDQPHLQAMHAGVG